MLKIFVVSEDFRSQAVDTLGFALWFFNHLVTQAERKRFIVEDASGREKDEKQDRRHHPIILPGPAGILPEESVLEKQEKCVEHFRISIVNEVSGQS